MTKLRSSCPINYGLELFGDQWSLLIIRDLIFNKKQTYGDFLSSAEGISTNILAKRLSTLEENGILCKSRSPVNKKIYNYSLTKRGESLTPVLVELILWGAQNGPRNEKLIFWAEQLKNDINRSS